MKKILFIILLTIFSFGGGYGFATETEEAQKDNGLSNLTVMSDNRAQIKLYAMLTLDDAQKLWDDFFILKNTTEIRDVDIYITSPGGGSYGGFAIIAQLRKAKKEGFNITAYGLAIVGSMAIPIFACCDHRVAYDSTIFMVHPASLQAGKASFEKADLQSQADFHDLTENQYVSVLAEFTKLSKEEWLKKIEKDTWFSAEQAKEWGLVDIIN